MGKTRGIGAPDDVLTIASQLECRRGEKNLENIWEMSVESMKIARNLFYYYSFFFLTGAKNTGNSIRPALFNAPTKKIWDRSGNS